MRISSVIPNFQFHYGTIKSSTSFPIPEMDSIFQFHYGTIKSHVQI